MQMDSDDEMEREDEGGKEDAWWQMKLAVSKCTSA